MSCLPSACKCMFRAVRHEGRWPHRTNDLRVGARSRARFSAPAARAAPLPARWFLALRLHRDWVMDWLELVVILAVWLLLQAFVLPRLGVPT